MAPFPPRNQDELWERGQQTNDFLPSWRQGQQKEQRMAAAFLRNRGDEIRCCLDYPCRPQRIVWETLTLVEMPGGGILDYSVLLQNSFVDLLDFVTDP